MKRFIIIVVVRGREYAVSRLYFDRFQAVDKLIPIYHDYGRKTASQAIVFDSRTAAEDYLERQGWLYGHECNIAEYNVGCNEVVQAC